MKRWKSRKARKNCCRKYRKENFYFKRSTRVVEKKEGKRK
jgi:hypothetical protein